MRLPARDLQEIAGNMARTGAELEHQRVFLTGGTGFVGRWLIESLLHLNAPGDRGNTIFVLSRNPAAFLAANPHLSTDHALKWVVGATATIEKSMVSGSCANLDLVIHAATPSSAELAGGDPLQIVETIEGTRRVLELAVTTGAKRFLYLSSGAVYGRQPSNVSCLEEDFGGAPDPSLPGSAYGETKRAGELLCASFARRYGLEAVIARGFAFIGPGLPLTDKFAVGSFLRDALERQAIRVAGDGTPVRSYLSAAEMIIWLWTLLFKGRPGAAYNVGSEEPVSIIELAREAAALPSVPLPVTIEKTDHRNVSPERYVPSTARAREELGLIQTVGWRESLRRTYAWLREGASEFRREAFP